MFCKRCRYNLKLIESRVCPECGRAFDAGKPKSFRKDPGWPKWLRRIGQALLLLLIALIGPYVNEWWYQQKLAAFTYLDVMFTQYTDIDYSGAETPTSAHLNHRRRLHRELNQ